MIAPRFGLFVLLMIVVGVLGVSRLDHTEFLSSVVARRQPVILKQSVVTYCLLFIFSIFTLRSLISLIDALL